MGSCPGQPGPAAKQARGVVGPCEVQVWMCEEARMQRVVDEEGAVGQQRQQEAVDLGAARQR